MKVLVISDIHDRNNYLLHALTQGKEIGCEAIFFCGDTSSPETFSLLTADGRPLYAVLGNIEEREEETLKLAQVQGHIRLDTHELSFTFEERHIALTHYPTRAQILAQSGTFDAVFHGHTHRARSEYIGKTIIGNPGEIAGNITKKRSIGIYDTSTNSFEIVPLTEV